MQGTGLSGGKFKARAGYEYKIKQADTRPVSGSYRRGVGAAVSVSRDVSRANNKPDEGSAEYGREQIRTNQILSCKVK